jgi:plastocyanin
LRYIINSVVDKVERRKCVGRVIKDANGDAVEQDVTFSWVVVVGHMAFNFGIEQPELTAGDPVRWTLEKV